MPPTPAPTDNLEPAAIDGTNAAIAAGLSVIGHRRPAFAPDPEAVPPPGSACPDCNGQTWLLDLVPPADWVCAGCFPSEHAVHLLNVINTAVPARTVTEPGGDDTAPLDGMGESEPPTRRRPPPGDLVEALAAALAERPGQRIVDPDRAKVYFHAEALRLLDLPHEAEFVAAMLAGLARPLAAGLTDRTFGSGISAWQPESWFVSEMS